MRRLRRLFSTHEAGLFVLLALLCVAIGWRNPSFFSLGNLFDLLKSSVTLGVLAVGVLVVLVSGDIDISFPAIAAASMYVSCLLARESGIDTPLLVIVAAAATIGCTLGLVNAALIHFFRLPALIVTLGTGSLIRGGLLGFIGTRIITDVPESMVAFSRMAVFRQRLPGGETIGLAVSFFVFVVVALLAHWLLGHTLLGRGVYALGGAPDAARRVGFDTRRIRFFVYGLVGALAGIVGVIHASSLRSANPFDFAGLELTVIAAVVLGGASITGGRGTVVGTVLGVFLLVVVDRSLLLVGLPTEWQKGVVGLILIGSTGLTAWRSRRRGEVPGHR